MKAPDPCERWMLQPPGDIIEQLIERSSRLSLPKLEITDVSVPLLRDRYYTQWRRFHVKRSMRGRESTQR